MESFVEQMRLNVAWGSVRSSTVERAPDLVSKLRKGVAAIDLAAFNMCHLNEFSDLLEAGTRRVMRHMPSGERHWGTARKVVNLFLRNATYNFLLRGEFNLARLESQLEIPLDSYSTKALRKRTLDRRLPPWLGMKRLTREDSKQYQDRAGELARLENTARVHLDIFYFLERD
jgi:hypothetical protein